METEKIITKRESHSVNISAGKPDSLRKVVTSFTTLRAYDGQHIGVAGQIGKTDENELYNKAAEALNRCVPYPCSLATDKKEADDVKKIFPSNEIVKVSSSLLARIEQAAPRFTASGKIELEFTEKEYTNSKASHLKYKGNNLEVSIAFKDKNSANIHDFYYGHGGFVYDEDAIVSDCKMLADAFLKEVAAPEKKIPIALDRGAVFSRTIGDLVPEACCNGAGKFANKIGKKLFADTFSLVVDRKRADEKSNAPFFDTEGTIDNRYKLIDGGIFRGLLSNKRSASLFNLPLSASAASDSFDSVPSYGTEGLHIVDTADKVTDIADSFIYVAITSGGDIAPDGTVGMPCQLCFLVENGKIVGRLPHVKLTANLFDLYGSAYMGTAKNNLYKGNCGSLDVFDYHIKK